MPSKKPTARAASISFFWVSLSAPSIVILLRFPEVARVARLAHMRYVALVSPARQIVNLDLVDLDGERVSREAARGAVLSHLICHHIAPVLP